MTDRELLEAAAKAAGIKVDWREPVQCLCYSSSPYYEAWNPLENDGDALRLAVLMNLQIDVYQGGDPHVAVGYGPGKADSLQRRRECIERMDVDNFTSRYAATRRAIVRAASALGEQGGGK